jgi:hypothetical protein
MTGQQGAHTLFTGQRERGGGESLTRNKIFNLFLKRITGALAPFSYLVFNNNSETTSLFH